MAHLYRMGLWAMPRVTSNVVSVHNFNQFTFTFGANELFMLAVAAEAQ